MRKIIPFNDNWSFTKDADPKGACFESVTLPHTWNNVDGMDGRGEYYRGKCWYAKTLETPRLPEGYRLCLEILALSLCGRVFVNGREAACHEGGFSSFVVDITDYLNPHGANELLILADNENHSHIYPQMADFTFYGGLYRGVCFLRCILKPPSTVHPDLPSPVKPPSRPLWKPR